MKRELSQEEIELAIFRWLEGYGEVDGVDPRQVFNVQFNKENIKAKVRYYKKEKINE